MVTAILFCLCRGGVCSDNPGRVLGKETPIGSFAYLQKAWVKGLRQGSRPWLGRSFLAWFPEVGLSRETQHLDLVIGSVFGGSNILQSRGI